MTIVETAVLRFPWEMPQAIRDVILLWPTWSKSPYSNSFYDVPSGQKTWTHTPEGSHRVSDHWNFVSQGEIHCQTDIPVRNGYWSLGRWESDKYIILQSLPNVRSYEVPDNEVSRMPMKQQQKREKHIRNMAGKAEHARRTQSD